MFFSVLQLEIWDRGRKKRGLEDKNGKLRQISIRVDRKNCLCFFDGFLGKISYGLAMNGWMDGGMHCGSLSWGAYCLFFVVSYCSEGRGKTYREDSVLRKMDGLR